MKYSVAVVTASALLASASPVAKRAMATAWVEKVVTVTVTASEATPTSAQPTAVFLEKPQTTQAAPPPAPPVANQAKEKKPSSKVVYVQPPKSSPAPAKAPVQQPGPQQSKPSKPAQPPSNGDYKSTALYHHNVHRSNHTAPDLEWDETLAQYAQNSAQSCQMVHDMDQGVYGQNIAVSGGQGGDHADSLARGISNQWYGGEMGNWHFWGMPNAPSNVGLNEYAHFTQLVWKGSKKVGCYTKSCPSIGAIGGMGGDITFCNYSPPGNYGGRYGENVLKPQGQSMLVV